MNIYTLIVTILLFVLIVIIVTVIFFRQHNSKIKTFIKQNKPIQLNHLNKLYEKFKYKFSNNNVMQTIYHTQQIYCITMPQRRDRAMREMNKLNTNITYLDAITPDDLNNTDYNTLSTTFIHGSNLYKKLTKLPVQLSFTMCFLDALKNGYKNFIIFEDDVIYESDNYSLDRSLEEFNKSPFCMYFLGYCFMDCEQKFDTKEYKHIINVPDKNVLCNHAIAFKTEYIHDLLDYFFPMVSPNDNLIINFLIDKKLDVCVPPKILFSQNRSQLGSFNDNNDPLPPTCVLNTKIF